MPKYRQLHVKILDSWGFAQMPNDFTRLFWVLLPLVLDSEGRGVGNTNWLRSRLFPMRNDVTDEMINDACKWLEDHEMMIFYWPEDTGDCYFYVPTFKQYQTGTEKEAKSVLPAPPKLWVVASENTITSTPELPMITPETPELPRVTQEFPELPRVTQSKQERLVSASASVNESESLSKSYFDFRDAEEVYRNATGFFTILPSHKNFLEPILTMIQKLGKPAAQERMTKCARDWVKQIGKNGKPWSLKNPGWIESAIADESIGHPPHLTTDEINANLIAEMAKKQK
jgi:hypothetical protein